MFNVSSSVGMNLNYAGQNLSTGPYAKKVENHRARKENYYSELGESQPMYPRFQPSFFFNLPSSNAHLAWTGVKKERKKKKFGQKTMNEWIGFVVEGCWEGGGHDNLSKSVWPSFNIKANTPKVAESETIGGFSQKNQWKVTKAELKLI